MLSHRRERPEHLSLIDCGNWVQLELPFDVIHKREAPPINSSVYLSVAAGAVDKWITSIPAGASARLFSIPCR